jgi:hypothetical protein
VDDRRAEVCLLALNFSLCCVLVVLGFFYYIFNFEFFQELQKKAAKGTSGWARLVPLPSPAPPAPATALVSTEAPLLIEASTTEASKEKEPAGSSTAAATAGGDAMLGGGGAALGDATTSTPALEDPKV